MYGKHYESMYEGSMVGAGLHVFAVWGYVIAKCRCGRVELNPKLLALVLGGTVEQIAEAITYLCRPDPCSRNKEHDGRRLVREGEYQYFVPSHEFYLKLRDEADRREYNRTKQAEYRARLRARDSTLHGDMV